MDAIVALALEYTKQGEFYPVVWRDYKKAKRYYQKSDLPILARVDVRMEGDWKDGTGRVQFRKPGEDWTPWEGVNLYSAISGLGMDIRWDTEVSGDGMKALRAWLSGEGNYEAVATFLRAQKRRDMEDEAQASAALRTAARKRVKKATGAAVKAAHRLCERHLEGWTFKRPKLDYPGLICITFKSADGVTLKMQFGGMFHTSLMKRNVDVEIPKGPKFRAPFKDALDLIGTMTARVRMKAAALTIVEAALSEKDRAIVCRAMCRVPVQSALADGVPVSEVREHQSLEDG